MFHTFDNYGCSVSVYIHTVHFSYKIKTANLFLFVELSKENS